MFSGNELGCLLPSIVTVQEFDPALARFGCCCGWVSHHLAGDVAKYLLHPDIPFPTPVVTLIFEDGDRWVEPSLRVPFICGYVAK
jgi:hypothetical protein